MLYYFFFFFLWASVQNIQEEKKLGNSHQHFFFLLLEAQRLENNYMGSQNILCVGSAEGRKLHFIPQSS